MLEIICTTDLENIDAGALVCNVEFVMSKVGMSISTVHHMCV